MATLHDPALMVAGLVVAGTAWTVDADGRRRSSTAVVTTGATVVVARVAATADDPARPVRATRAEAATAVRALRRVNLLRRESMCPVCADAAAGSMGLCRAAPTDPTAYVVGRSVSAVAGG